VFEHVTELAACADECLRVLKPGGLLYVSVPRAAAFDDRFYRFAGYFAKYALLKFKKRIEHQQRFDFASLLALFYERGFVLEGFSLVPRGFLVAQRPAHEADAEGVHRRARRRSSAARASTSSRTRTSSAASATRARSACAA
jgi:SAM-dependent methyltransferase